MQSWGSADVADCQDLDNELQVKVKHMHVVKTKHMLMSTRLPDGTCGPRH